MEMRSLETVVGFLVIVMSLYFGYEVSRVGGFMRKESGGYKLYAEFEDIGGIEVGSEVKLSGIKVGCVESVSFGANSLAKIGMRINDGVAISKDSRAVVSSEGLVGKKYVRIKVGVLEEKLSYGGNLEFTESSMNFEDIIGRLVYFMGKETGPRGK